MVAGVASFVEPTFQKNAIIIMEILEENFDTGRNLGVSLITWKRANNVMKLEIEPKEGRSKLKLGFAASVVYSNCTTCMALIQLMI